MVSACQTPIATFCKKKLSLSLDNLHSQITELAKAPELIRQLLVFMLFLKVQLSLIVDYIMILAIKFLIQNCKKKKKFPNETLLGK